MKITFALTIFTLTLASYGPVEVKTERATVELGFHPTDSIHMDFLREELEVRNMPFDVE